MTITFTRTRNQLAAMTLRKLGVLGNTGSADSADLDICYEAIDLRLKEMHRHGTFWRKVDRVPATFSLSANTNSAHAATSDILFPISMTVLDGSLDEPVEIIGVPEYAAISNKADTGLPTKALWKGSNEFLMWPIPTAATTVKLVYEKIADDSSAGSAPDVEVSMLRWLKDIIAYDISDDFGVDEAKIARFMKEAGQAEKNIRKLNADRKASKPVAVDEWYAPTDRRKSDYGW